MGNGSRSFDRRSMLRLMGGAGAAAATGGVLAACSDDSDDGNADNGPSASGPSASKGPSASGPVVIATITQPLNPDMDSDAFYEKWLPVFTERTGIETELRGFPNAEYHTSVQLLFSQDEPPDVFRSAGTPIAWPVPLQRGWVRSVEEFVTDEYKAQWPEGSFDPAISGLHAGEELYGVTGPAAAGPVFPLFSNLDVLEQYGGVSAPPSTWSEFAEVAERIAVDSGGEVGGFAPNIFAYFAMQATAGPDIRLGGPTGLNLASGRSEAAAPQQVELMELLQGMNAAGAFMVGWAAEGLRGEDVWSAMAQDQLAMIHLPNWHYRPMLELREDLPLAITEVPVPDSGRGGYQMQSFVFLPYWHMSESTENPEGAWQVMEFLSSPEVVADWYAESKKNPPPLPRSAYEEQLDQWDRAMLDVKASSMRFGPDAMMKSIDAAEVQGWINGGGPQPALPQVRNGVLIEESDYANEAAAYDEANNANIDEQLERAEAEGLDVTRDTFTFTDWNPLEDYQPPGGAQWPDWS